MSRTIKDVLNLFPETTAKDWNRHKNGGGWVKTSAHADESAYIEGLVYGNARVFGDARVSDNARVCGNARVSDNARVLGDAWETSPLYIRGSRHCATNAKYGHIAIGCEVHTFAEWLKNYKAIGKVAGYTPEQVKEYKAIIDLFVKIGR